MAARERIRPQFSATAVARSSNNYTSVRRITGNQDFDNDVVVDDDSNVDIMMMMMRRANGYETGIDEAPW